MFTNANANPSVFQGRGFNLNAVRNESASVHDNTFEEPLGRTGRMIDDSSDAAERVIGKMTK